MLNVSHVTKKYGKVCACSDVSFHLDPGSVTVLLGPNGSMSCGGSKAVSIHAPKPDGIQT